MPIDRDLLTQDALNGMLNSLDPYSGYLPPVDYSKMNESLEQQFAGIGAEIVIHSQTRALAVGALIYGSPAQQSGLLPGDQILAINGESSQGLLPSAASSKLRGAAGSVVSLRVLRRNQKEPVEFDVERKIISTSSILGDRRLSDGRWTYFLQNAYGIAYVKIIGFGMRTPSELGALIPSLQKKGMKGLIIDLRGNPGGTLNAAVGVCNLFVPENEVIVSIKSRTGIKSIKAEKGEKFRSFPVAVLIDSLSASASEITAACLQDYASQVDENGMKLNVVLIGQRSFGKGTVQDMYSLMENQGAIKITIAGYVRPNGKNIHRNEQTQLTDQWGVKPDAGYNIEQSKDALTALARWRSLRALSIDNSKPGDNPPFGNPALYDPCVKKALDYFATLTR